MVFLVPGLPDDAICLAAGLTRLDLRWILLVSVVGWPPATRWWPWPAPGSRATAAGDERLVGLLAALSVAAYLGRRAILRWLTRGEPLGA